MKSTTWRDYKGAVIDMKGRVPKGLLNEWDLSDDLNNLRLNNVDVFYGLKEIGGFEVGHITKEERAKFAAAGVDMKHNFNAIMDPDQPSIVHETYGQLQITKKAGETMKLSKISRPKESLLKFKNQKGDYGGIDEILWNKIINDYVADELVLKVSSAQHAQNLNTPAGILNVIDHKVLTDALGKPMELLLNKNPSKVKLIKRDGEWFGITDPKEINYLSMFIEFKHGNSDHVGLWGICPGVQLRDTADYYNLVKADPSSWKLFTAKNVYLFAVYKELQRGVPHRRESCHLSLNEFMATVTTGANALGDESTYFLNEWDESKWNAIKVDLHYNSTGVRTHVAPLLDKNHTHFAVSDLYGSGSTWGVKCSHGVLLRLSQDSTNHRIQFRSQDVAGFKDIGFDKVGPPLCDECGFHHIYETECIHLLCPMVEFLGEAKDQIRLTQGPNGAKILTKEKTMEFIAIMIEQYEGEFIEKDTLLLEHAEFFEYPPKPGTASNVLPRFVNMCEEFVFDFYSPKDRSPSCSQSPPPSDSLTSVLLNGKEPSQDHNQRSQSPPPQQNTRILKIEWDEPMSQSSLSASIISVPSALLTTPEMSSTDLCQGSPHSSTSSPQNVIPSQPPTKRRRIQGNHRSSPTLSSSHSNHNNRDPEPQEYQIKSKLSRKRKRARSTPIHVSQSTLAVDPLPFIPSGMSAGNVFNLLDDFESQ